MRILISGTLLAFATLGCGSGDEQGRPPGVAQPPAWLDSVALAMESPAVDVLHGWLAAIATGDRRAFDSLTVDATTASRNAAALKLGPRGLPALDEGVREWLLESSSDSAAFVVYVPAYRLLLDVELRRMSEGWKVALVGFWQWAGHDNQP